VRQFVVIGCGRFGQSLAETLFDMGYDVLAIDKSAERIQEVSTHVTHAVQADALEENNLRSLGISNFDVAVVTIGSNMQASIMATLLTKELGVKTVIAKAQNELHGKVLEKIGADRVVYPEQDMGIRVARNLISTNILDIIEFAPDYSIVEVATMDDWVGRSLKDLKLPNKYGITVIAIKGGETINISPYAEDIIKEGDVLIVIGQNKALKNLERKV
jgi:trk system potassium uptake protein TrkA